MTTKNEVATQNSGASLVVNNQFIDGLISQLAEKEKFGLVFPSDYNYANELMGAYLVLKDTVDKEKKPVLESCSQASIANTLMDMVTMGLSMQKKQCYPVAYGKKLQLQVSVYGNTCSARRYGLRDISAMVIYEGDEFAYHIEDAEIVIDKHTQNFMNINTDKIAGAYAVAIMQDSRKHVELMNISMIRKAWAQGYGYKPNGNGTHQLFADQMALKSVKNRCLKYIIRTYGTQAMSDFIDKEDVMEQEDRVILDTEATIAENANKIEFSEAEVVGAVVDTSADEVESSVVPDFMQEG